MAQLIQKSIHGFLAIQTFLVFADERVTTIWKPCTILKYSVYKNFTNHKYKSFEQSYYNFACILIQIK